MEIIKTVLDQGIFTRKVFKHLESLVSFGIIAVNETDRNNKIKIKSTKREIWIKVIVNELQKIKYKIVAADEKVWLTLVSKGNKLNCYSKFALVRKGTSEAYTENGPCDASTLGDAFFRCIFDGKCDLKSAFEKHVREMSEICDAFGLDAKKEVYTDFMISKKIAYKYLKYIRGAQHATEEENVWLEGSTRGALQYAEKKVIKDCFDYDINSMYSHVLAATDFKFPLSQAEVTDINTEVEEGTLEIYKLNILGGNRFWTNTPDNYYNTYHIELLNLLEIKFEFVGETKLVYDDPLKSKEMFGFMDKLYELKLAGNSCAKPIGNLLWGLLSRSKDYEVPIKNLAQHEMKDVKQIRIEKGFAIMKSRLRPLRHVTGRLKSFLLAYVRLFMIKNILLPLEKKGFDIFQSNTDCVVTDATVEEMNEIYPVSNQRGHLKLEKELKGYHKIWHVRRIEEYEPEVDVLEADE